MLNVRLLYSINMQEVGSTEQLNQSHRLHQSHAAEGTQVGRTYQSDIYLPLEMLHGCTYFSS